MIIVEDRQNLLDLALIQYGNIADALALAIENDMSLTDDLTPGMKLTPIAKTLNYDDRIVYDFARFQNERPATATPLIEFTSETYGLPEGLPIGL